MSNHNFSYNPVFVSPELTEVVGRLLPGDVPVKPARVMIESMLSEGDFDSPEVTSQMGRPHFSHANEEMPLI